VDFGVGEDAEEEKKRERYLSVPGRKDEGARKEKRKGVREAGLTEGTHHPKQRA
jgi:hypothetical protein